MSYFQCKQKLKFTNVIEKQEQDWVWQSNQARVSKLFLLNVHRYSPISPSDIMVLGEARDPIEAWDHAIARASDSYSKQMVVTLYFNNFLSILFTAQSC